MCVVCEAVLGFQISSEKHGAAPAPCYSLSTENLTVCLLFPAEHDHTQQLPSPRKYGNMHVRYLKSFSHFVLQIISCSQCSTDELIQYRELHPSASVK